MNTEIVITGTIPNIKRNEFSKILELLGASVKDSVSSSVDYLVVGFASGGKKLADAMRLGVEVIPYAYFLTKLGTLAQISPTASSRILCFPLSVSL